MRLSDMETLTRFLNQHSFSLVSAVGMVILAVVLLRDGVQLNDVIALAALAIGIGLAFLLLNPGPSTVARAEAVSEQIGAGKPVLVEFQSPY